jgi:hypothetical protein
LTEVVQGGIYDGVANPVSSFSFAITANLISALVNGILATMLAGRLLWFGRKYRQCFGGLRAISVYTSPAVIIIESAVLYTVPQLVGSVMLLGGLGDYANIPLGLAIVFAVNHASQYHLTNNMLIFY